MKLRPGRAVADAAERRHAQLGPASATAPAAGRRASRERANCDVLGPRRACVGVVRARGDRGRADPGRSSAVVFGESACPVSSGQPRERGARLTRSSACVLPTLQERGFDRRRVGGERGAVRAREPCVSREPRFEVGDRRGQRAGTLLQQGGREEGVVHLLPQREERDAHAGLRFRELGAFEVRLRALTVGSKMRCSTRR